MANQTKKSYSNPAYATSKPLTAEQIKNRVKDINQSLNIIGSTTGKSASQVTDVDIARYYSKAGTSSGSSSSTQTTSSNKLQEVIKPKETALTPSINKTTTKINKTIVPSKTSPTGYVDKLGQPVSVKPDASYTSGGSTYNPATNVLESSDAVYTYKFGDRVTVTAKEGSKLQTSAEGYSRYLNLVNRGLITPQEEVKPKTTFWERYDTDVYSKSPTTRFLSVPNFLMSEASNYFVGKQPVTYSDIPSYKVRGSIAPNLDYKNLLSSQEILGIETRKTETAKRSFKLALQTSPVVISNVPTLPASATSLIGGYYFLEGSRKFTEPSPDKSIKGNVYYYGSAGLDLAIGSSLIKSGYRLAQVEALTKSKPLYKFVDMKYPTTDGFISYQAGIKSTSVPKPLPFYLGKPETKTFYSGISQYIKTGKGSYQVVSGRGYSLTQFENIFTKPSLKESYFTFYGDVSKTIGSFKGKKIKSAFEGGLTIAEGKRDVIKVIKKNIAGFPVYSGKGKSVVLSGELTKGKMYYRFKRSGYYYDIKKTTGVFKPEALGISEIKKPVKYDYNFIPSGKRASASLITPKNIKSYDLRISNLGKTKTFVEGFGQEVGKASLEFAKTKPTLLFSPRVSYTSPQKKVLVSRFISRPLTKTDDIIKTKTDIINFGSYYQPQAQAQQSQTTYRTIINEIGGTPTPSVTSVKTPSTFIPIIPFIPSGEFSGGLSKRKIRGKRKYKYTPSYEALVFNITGSKPRGVETGARVRPIPKGFKFYSSSFKFPSFKL